MLGNRPKVHQQESLDLIASNLELHPNSLHLVRDKVREQEIRQILRQEGWHYGVRYYGVMSDTQEVATATDKRHPNSISKYRTYSLVDGETIEHEVSKYF